MISEGPLLGFSNPNGVAPLGDGFVGLGRPPRDDDPETPEAFVLRFSRNGAEADTVAPLFAAVPYRLAQLGQPIPQFQPSVSSTAAGGFLWAGWEGEYAIRRWRADGTLEQIVRLDYAGEPVTDAIRDSVVEAQPATVEGGAPRRFDFPERIPAWGKLLGTDTGWLWVRRTRSPFESSEVFDIFAPDGRLAAYIRIPADARLSEVGDDHVLGIFPGNLDVETVRRYRIRKGSGNAGAGP